MGATKSKQRYYKRRKENQQNGRNSNIPVIEGGKPSGPRKEEPIEEVEQRDREHQISKHPGSCIITFNRHNAPMLSPCFQLGVSKINRAKMYMTIQTMSNVAKTLARWK